MGEKNNFKELSHFYQVRENIEDTLFQNKTPKYSTRFISWASEIKGEHLDNLLDAVLASINYVIVTGNRTKDIDNTNVEFLRGMAEGVLLMKHIIITYSAVKDSSEEKFIRDINDLFNQ